MPALSPSLRLDSSPASLAAPRRLSVGTGDLQDLIEIECQAPFGGLALFMAGFRLESGTEPAPEINWQLFTGTARILDDEPVWQGTTTLKTMAREGLLVKVFRPATTYFLRGYCSAGNGAHAVSFSPAFLLLPFGSLGPLVEAGSVVG